MIVVSDGRYAMELYGNIEELYQYCCLCCCCSWLAVIIITVVVVFVVVVVVVWLVFKLGTLLPFLGLYMYLRLNSVEYCTSHARTN